MKDVIGYVVCIPDGVSRKVVIIRQRFRYDRRTISACAQQYSQQENNAIQEHKRRSIGQESFDLKANNVFYLTTQGKRSRVARNVRSYEWRFIRTDRTLWCDVDTEKYPYELIRGGSLSGLALWVKGGSLLSLAQPEHKLSAASVSNSFGDHYFQSVARALHKKKIKGPMTVKACFGQTLFQIPVHIDVNRKFRFNDLPNLKSSWSNVCNTKEPSIRALLSQLNGDGASEATMLRLTIRCCLTTQKGPRYAKIIFSRKDGNWIYERACALIREYGCHEIFLRNELSLRVKVFSQVSTPGKAWWSTIHERVCFHEARNGDPFATKVTLESPTRENVRIDFVAIKELSDTVRYRGLYFQLSKKTDSISLQVLPPRKELRKKRAGECFKFLVTKLVQILDDLGNVVSA